MSLASIETHGMVLLGCGKMGSAMLAGWLANGLSPSAVWVLDPYPSEWLKSTGVHINEGVPEVPAVALIAVKPQMMGEALPSMKALGNGETVFLSVAAGTSIATFADALGAQSPIIRAMPNTPAAIGRGITAIVGNEHTSDVQMDLADALLSAVGQVVRLDDEDQMDAVTAVSGSGPAYVFHLVETLAAAGEAEGLPAELAMKLAKATVGGAGQLAEDAEDEPEQLRINVTSPNGTTQAALEVLMEAETGFPKLLRRAVKAAADRSRELGK
ncbi:pyrroline-5-carboxylate reductase [Octadecabacter temperatus]|uniref:Pyrroline-5-carboxylate reductase n=1 Tax=Octadecabacter temperatus TaxID=1458307 RepID=A0A0K0Y7G8_9RHOB|nr:pyrroline-5-carboxylate reductase [Octadecabacter temperatus]AKS46919.1 Pyrroline-5-carboxylate reductase [Octadecabacter temperatus]SIO23645.1 pyrroline-5-carboxylate reductase [Octadecabacter temperatus]